jgi:hypothetical protein
MAFSDDMTLGEARDELRELVKGKGAICPLCTQNAKIYPRSLPLASAKVMVELFKRNEGRDYIDVPEVLDTMKGTAHQGGYGTLSWHWGLIEPMPGQREDGSNRVGWWRLTDRGRAFVRGEVTVPRKARIYANRLLSFEGEQWTISDALRHPFDFRELMGW